MDRDIIVGNHRTPHACLSGFLVRSVLLPFPRRGRTILRVGDDLRMGSGALSLCIYRFDSGVDLEAQGGGANKGGLLFDHAISVSCLDPSVELG